MKFEEKIKQKFLYSTKFNLFKFLYFFFQGIKGKKSYKKSFSGGAQDLIINYFFKNKSKGIYLDIGCFHPFIGNNTYKLFQKGWNGINIDLDFHTIDLFNYFRKNDSNINIGVSDKTGNQDLYFFHNRAAINTLSQLRGKNFKEIKKIKTDTLNNIIQATKFKDCKIDFLSVDVEGYEMQVLRDFNFKKYCPDLIVVEYLEPNLEQVEFHNQSLKNIFQSELYNFMIKNDYTMVNWLHSDLIFVSNRIREK